MNNFNFGKVFGRYLQSSKKMSLQKMSQKMPLYPYPDGIVYKYG